MKRGYSLAEMMVYLALIATFLSFLVPSMEGTKRRLTFLTDIESVEHFIRYARQISAMKMCKSAVIVKKGEVVLYVGGKLTKRRRIFCRVDGNRAFAFSKGIPYVSGKMRLTFDKKIISLTVLPITGMIKAEWE